MVAYDKVVTEQALQETGSVLAGEALCGIS